MSTVMDLITQSVNKHAEAEPEVQTPEEPVEEASPFPTDIFEEDAPAAATEEEKSPEQLALEEALASDEPPKNGKAWGAIKARNRELEELLAKAGSSDQVTKLEQEILKRDEQIAAQDELIARIKLEESAAFKREHDQQIVGELTQIASVLSESLGKTPEEAKAIVQRASRMSSLVDRTAFLNDEAGQLGPLLGQMFVSVDARVRKRAEALKNAAATSLALQESETHVAHVNTIKTVEAALNKAVEDLATTNRFYKKSKEKSPVGENWNQSIDLRVQAVKQTLLNNKPEEITRLVAAGFAVPEMQKEMARLQQVAAEATAELKKYKSHKPGVEGRETPGDDKKPVFSAGQASNTVDNVTAFLKERM